MAEHLILPSGPSLAALRRRLFGDLLLHGRVLTFGHLAILCACIWKILATVTSILIFVYAAFACVPDLHLSKEDAIQSLAELMNSSKSPTLEHHIPDILARKEAIFTHFRQVQHGYTAPLVCLILLLASLWYVLVWTIWNYLIEGLAARSLENADDLLRPALAALPPEFPKTRLVSASDTFVRFRIGAGITTFLSNNLLVRLRNGQTNEFQFALLHEAYHLRCFDPLCNGISKSLRRILAFAGAATCAFIGAEWAVDVLVGEKSPLAPNLRLMSWIVIFAVAITRLLRLDIPFLKHKELLADRYAWRSRPAANLDLLYNREIRAKTHPSCTERIRFLRQGRCSTACAAFLATQEAVLCCVFLVSARSFGDPLGKLPQDLEFPAFLLALAGSWILGIEACRYPLPAAARNPLLRRTFLTVLFCILLFGQPQTPWFSSALLMINAVVLLHVASRNHQSPEEVATVEERSAALSAPRPRAPMRFTGMIEIAGSVFSWTAVIWTAPTALWLLFELVVIRGFTGPFPQEVLKAVPIDRTLLSVAEGALLAFASVRNLKRPNVLTLILEWFLYAGVLLTLGGAWLWVSAKLSSHGWKEAVLVILRLPWANPQALRRIFHIDLLRSLWVTSVPQITLAAFYGLRLRVSYRNAERRGKPNES